MDRNNKTINNRIFSVLINLFWFVIIAFISYRMPMFSDDLVQSKSFVTGGDIENFDMILPSVIAFYNTINGRFISFFFIQLMLYLPRIVFATVNASVYVVLVNVTSEYVFVAIDELSDELRIAVLGLIYVGFWYMMPAFAEVVTWPSGCINYLWMNCVVLGFGLLYYRDFNRRLSAADATDSIGGNGHKERTGITYMVVSIMGYAVLGFCAGLSAEASAAALIFALILYVVYMIRHHIMIAPCRIVGIVSCFIGYGFLVLAPGAHAKGNSSAAASETAGFLVNYLHRIGRETFYTVLYMTLPLAILLMLYLLSGRRFCRRDIGQSFIYGRESFFVLVAFASIYVMTFASGFADRIFQFPLLCLLIASGMAFVQVNVSDRLYRATMILCILLMILALTEVVAGSLYAVQSGSFFDRHMYYNYIENTGTSGLLPGNGVLK